MEELTPDLTKIHSDKAQIHLVHFLSTAEKTVSSIDLDSLKTAQPSLHAFLLSLLAATDASAPPPARPVRRLAARILVSSCARIPSLAHNAFSSLHACIADNRASREARVACLNAAAALAAAHGSRVASILPETVALCLRTVRSSLSQPFLSHAALFCLAKSLQATSTRLPESISKDISKVIRAAFQTNSRPLHRAASHALLASYQTQILPLGTYADIEAQLNQVLRPLQHADLHTRRSLSLLLSALLASTLVPGSASPSKNAQQKSNKKDASKKDSIDDDDPYPIITTTSSLLTLPQALSLLSSAYAKPNFSKTSLTTAIVHVYATFFHTLGTPFVHENYHTILHHIVYSLRLAPNPASSFAHFDILTHRAHLIFLLRNVIANRILTEQGQIAAIREITDSYLNTWPEASTDQVVSPEAFVVLLDQLAVLLSHLGSSPPSIQDSLSQPLVRFLLHPHRPVQLSAAYALRAYTCSAPSRLSPCLSDLLDRLQDDITLLNLPPDGSSSTSLHSSSSTSPPSTRALGRAFGIAALTASIPNYSLYVAHQLSEKIMEFAIKLLKDSGEHSLHISGTEIEIAWILITSLMSLGPTFTSKHVSDLQLLWRSAFPKSSSSSPPPTNAEALPEWAFLFHVREAAATSIYQFLQFNSHSLLDQDLARRIVSFLSNGLNFADSFLAQQNLSDLLLSQEQPPSSSSTSLPSSSSSSPYSATSSIVSLQDRLRARIYQCFVALGRHPATESVREYLVSSSLNILADPDRNSGSQIQAAIQASSGTFTSLWTQGDGFTYGVTSLVTHHGLNLNLHGENSVKYHQQSNKEDPLELEIQDLLRTPIRGAIEHDWISILSSRSSSSSSSSSPPTETTRLVDSAVQIFAIYFFSLFAKPEFQSSILRQMMLYLRSTKLDKNPGRKAAALVNSLAAILGGLRLVVSSPQSSLSTKHMFDSVRKLQDRIYEIMVLEAIDNHDERVRNLAAESVGIISSSSSSSKTITSHIQTCVTQIVNNTDPSCRAGRARCLAQIYCHVGSMSAGPSVLKTIVDVLLSLSSDPHPIVHYYALDSLARVISTAGLAYEPYANATLGILVDLYYRNSHEPEGGSASTVNIRAEYPAYIPMCQIIDNLISVVLGPELQHTSPLRSLVLLLIREFMREGSVVSVSDQKNDDGTINGDDEDENADGVHVEALKALQHLLLFSPNDVDLANLIQILRRGLLSQRRPLKVASINSVYQLVQKHQQQQQQQQQDHNDNSFFDKSEIVGELFALMDDDPSVEGVRDTILSWISQTAVQDVNFWIDVCQGIVSRVNTSSDSANILNASTTSSSNQAGNSNNSGNKSALPAGVGGFGIVGFSDEESQGLSAEVTNAGNNVVEDVTYRNKSSNDTKFSSQKGGRGSAASRRMGGVPPRWRTQRFALKCLHMIFRHLSSSSSKSSSFSKSATTLSYHFNPERAKLLGISPKNCLFHRISDLIKIAFTASTAQVMEIRLAGLTILRDVIESFKDAPDPDFKDLLLLEQHQAPITAALTPAFSAEDSCPEVLASATEICAVFVGSALGGQQYVFDRMGRIIKLLTSALENCKDPDMTSLANVTNLCTTASKMLKTAVYSAWAELLVASSTSSSSTKTTTTVEKKNTSYLDPILKPHLEFLSRSWIDCLVEYAQVRAESKYDDDNNNSKTSQGDCDEEDSIAGGLTRKGTIVLLDKSWYNLLHAVAVLLQREEQSIIRAMEGSSTETSNDTKKEKHFYVIFGLAYEYLCNPRSTADQESNVSYSLSEARTNTALEALKGLLGRPSLIADFFLVSSSPPSSSSNNYNSGGDYSDSLSTIFTEFLTLCFRLVATRSCKVQENIVGTLKELAVNYVAYEKSDTKPDTRSDLVSSQAVLNSCLQIITTILEQNLPSNNNNSNGQKQNHDSLNDRANALKAAFSVYAEIVMLYDQNMRNDLISVPIYLYYLILNAENVQVDLITPTLPALRQLCEVAFTCLKPSEKEDVILPRHIQNLLTSTLQNVDGMSGRSGTAVSIKTKGNILAAVLILTSTPDWVKLNLASVEHCCFSISRLLLSEDNEVAVASIHCTQTLFVSASKKPNNDKPTPLQFCVGQLIPSLINNHLAKASHGKKEARWMPTMNEKELPTVIFNQILNILESVVEIVSPDDKIQVYRLLVPAFTGLLLETAEENKNVIVPTHLYAVRKLVSLASNDPVVFKICTETALDEGERSKLESSIRRHLISPQEHAALAESASPAISLKSFG